eukprot:11213018-Lingulodinium_polyedra.AAC.1
MSSAFAAGAFILEFSRKHTEFDCKLNATTNVFFIRDLVLVEPVCEIHSSSSWGGILGAEHRAVDALERAVLNSM